MHSFFIQRGRKRKKKLRERERKKKLRERERRNSERERERRNSERERESSFVYTSFVPFFFASSCEP